MTTTTDDPVEQLIETYGYWLELPAYPVADWQNEVVNGDTRQGYWEWVESKIAKDESE